MYVPSRSQVSLLLSLLLISTIGFGTLLSIHHGVRAADPRSHPPKESPGTNISVHVAVPNVNPAPLSVYVGPDDGPLYALDASQGKLRWMYPCPLGSPMACEWTTPVVMNGVVYVAAKGIHDYKIYTVFALNALDGSVRWSYPLPIGGGGSLVVANGLVYFLVNGTIASKTNYIYALRAIDGSVVWTQSLGYNHVFLTDPSVANGVLYIGTGGTGSANARNILALNASNGSVIWSHTVSPAILSGILYTVLIVVDGVIYYQGIIDSLYAINAKDGSFLWALHKGHFCCESDPLIQGGVVYISGFDRAVHAVSTNDVSLWQYSIGGGTTIFTSPAIANGVLYIGTIDKYMYAINASTGALIWKQMTGVVTTTAVVANGIVYVGDGNGTTVHAFNASNGSHTWTHRVTGQIYDSSLAVG